MPTVSSDSILNGHRFSIGDNVVVSEKKSFTVLDVDIRVCPVSKDVEVYLHVNYDNDGQLGSDVIASSQLINFLK